MKKIHFRLLFAAIALITGIVAFLMAGCASKPPTAFEQRMFTVTTNYEPVIVVKTNIIPVTLVKTNVIEVTNVTGVTEFRTNFQPILVYTTNVITEQRTNESYNYKPGAGAAEIQRVGGEVGGMFGVGGIVSTAFGFLFSAWAYIRSRKNYATAANIAQTVETLREFIKSLPDGESYDTQFVSWMQANQARAGVLVNVLALLEREVSNPDAKVAAAQIRLILQNLPKT